MRVQTREKEMFFLFEEVRGWVFCLTFFAPPAARSRRRDVGATLVSAARTGLAAATERWICFYLIGDPLERAAKIFWVLYPKGTTKVFK